MSRRPDAAYRASVGVHRSRVHRWPAVLDDINEQRLRGDTIVAFGEPDLPVDHEEVPSPEQPCSARCLHGIIHRPPLAERLKDPGAPSAGGMAPRQGFSRSRRTVAVAPGAGWT